jgi:excisionase family DNA binding protein
MVTLRGEWDGRGWRGACGVASERSVTIRASVAQEPFREARFVTVSEVAQLLRVSKMTVYRLIKQGDLPAVRIGRGFRLREEDVRRYLDSRYTEAG